MDEHARGLQRQRSRRPRQPDVPGRLPALSARASTWRTPTGPAWPPPPRSGCPSSTPWSFTAAFSLPGDQKVHGRTQKFALKEAARQWLPKEVVDRPKASFSAPLRAWVAARPARAHRRHPRAGRARRVGLSPPPGGGHAHRGGAQRPRGPVEAHLAVADPRAVVPPGTPWPECSSKPESPQSQRSKRLETSRTALTGRRCG